MFLNQKSEFGVDVGILPKKKNILVNIRNLSKNVYVVTFWSLITFIVSEVAFPIYKLQVLNHSKECCNNQNKNKMLQIGVTFYAKQNKDRK